MVRKVMGNIYHWWKNEKKASKILMIFAAFLIVFSVIIGRVSNVSFAADIPDRMTSSIQSFEDGYPAFGLFDGITLGSVFVASDDANNRYIMYCLEKEKDWDTNVTLTRTEKLDAGYAYIIQNAYPAKSFTNGSDSNTDYYLTQVAIWWYQDRIAGVSDSEDGVLTASQKQEIRSSQYGSTLLALVDNAVDARNTYQDVDPEFSVSSSSFHLDNSGTYLETDYIDVSSNVSFSTYQVAVDMSSAQIINESNQVVSGKLNRGERFKIRLPLRNLSSSDLTLAISVIIDYQEYEAYQFVPDDSHPNMQNSIVTSVIAVAKQASTSTNVTIPTGSLRVEKVNDSGQLLPGAEIEVRRAINNELVARFTSTSEAYVINNLLPGEYTVTELSAPSGYLVQSDSVSVILDTSNMNGVARLVNSPVTIRIRKIDRDSGQAIAGALIRIFDDSGSQVYEFRSTTDYVTIPGLEVGRYQAVEVEAPDGYYLNSDPVSFEVTEDNPSVSVDIENDLNEVEIIKVDASTNDPLSGARLRVVNRDTGSVVEEWTSTNSAHVITGIPSGNYQVEEVSPPDGYTANTNVITFTVSRNQTEKITVSFPNTQSQIAISKVDSETGQLIAGARLAIYNASGDQVMDFTSETTPTVIEKLEVGQYTVRELEAPNGYQLNSDSVSFEVTDNTSNLQVTMQNTKNRISIAKVDADTKTYLAGAVLRLVNEDGDQVEQWTSTNDVHVITGLERGVYYLEEVSAPTGYVRNTERIEIRITRNTTTETYTMENQSVSVRIAKVDKDSKDLVAGATLELLNSNYEVLETWITTDSYRVFDDLAEGRYYVRETSSPSGYVLNSDVESFTIDSNHISHTIALENEKTKVRLGKVDATTGNYIAGAVLRLTREDGGMDAITFTSEDHATVIEGLSSGTYILEEVSAPTGYITCNSKVTFELDASGDTRNISLRSDYATISVQDKKLVIDTAGVGGYEFQLYTADHTLVDTFEVGEEVFTSEVLDNGSYLLEQTDVPDGMVINSNLYSFTISDDDSSQVVHFANDYTRVNILKQEMMGGDLLAGAHFILRDGNGNVVDEWNSTTSAKTIEKLAPGTYSLSEISAPDGYQLNSSLLSFEVEATGDIQTFTMYNALEVDVPNTSQNALLYMFLGSVILLIGFSIFGYVYFKKAL